MHLDISQFSPKQHIIIKGADLHNLKDIDVVIPRNKLVVITGLSGSGKSTLAFDTLYAEGQRRYVESLSSYARQFMGKLNKPKVKYIKGIAPAIAIEQKVNTSSSRSTVGTLTEIYDYLKILFARVGRTYSPISGEEVKKHNTTDVLNYILGYPSKSKLLLLAPVYISKERTTKDILTIFSQQGFARIFYKGKVMRLDEVKEIKEDFYLVIDRIIVKQRDKDFENRLYDNIETAFYEGRGSCIIKEMEGENQAFFSNKFELDGLQFIEPNIHFFSFNNPYGVCPKCRGYGSTTGIDESLVIPDTSLSVYDGAIAPWKGTTLSKHRDELVRNAYRFDFPIHRPWFKLTEKEKELVWKGNSYFLGISNFFEKLEEKIYKIQNRVMLSRYYGRAICKTCKGKRLRQEVNYVKIGGKSITDLVNIPLSDLMSFFKTIKLMDYEHKIAKRVLREINSRLDFLMKTGLGYLTLNRQSNTLSGGEYQRINLATSLGSSLVGSMYIIDEPSIGLHPKDTLSLISVLKSLRDLGNTVIVVEHDEDIIRMADEIIDIGPFAGTNGGQLVGFGTLKDIVGMETPTAHFLNGKKTIPIPQHRRKTDSFVKVFGARANNLKNINVKFPLDCLVVVSGISGSGKSTLVKAILYPALQKHFDNYGEKPREFSKLAGHFEHLVGVECVDQNPIGRSSRSNPVTYIKVYDEIRHLFASEKLAKAKGYKSVDFSFNTGNGRCEACNGDGITTVEMQFMADIHMSCEVCKGNRFKRELLEDYTLQI
ncbi:UvrABC system protein A [Elysia marginata]|uniref:UvrABC system protein A n=1 Tax=Elysia marginata TaxID=1093978 RepID=A0AAV4G6D4_9GAST|nr:UvrABC system protein A [Elysia marginata]